MMSSILWATLGGALIGLAASWLLLTKGRIAGISGIVGGLLSAWSTDSAWRLAFLLGLMTGGMLLMATSVAFTEPPSTEVAVSARMA